MRTLIVRAAIATVFVPVAASAQSLSLTESEALARLSADSPRVQAIRASADVARADALAAARWPNPRLVINRESSAGITEYITTIGQVLPITGRRGLAVSAASASADGVASRADEEIRRVRADVRLAFADLVAEQSRESELRVAVARVRELAAAIAKREAAGDAAGFDQPARRARSAGRRCGWIGGRRGPGQGPGGADGILRRRSPLRVEIIAVSAGTSHRTAPACG